MYDFDDGELEVPPEFGLRGWWPPAPMFRCKGGCGKQVTVVATCCDECSFDVSLSRMEEQLDEILRG